VCSSFHVLYLLFPHVLCLPFLLSSVCRMSSPLQDASEITYFYAQLKRRNDAASREVDAVFMERAEREKGVHRLEEQVRARSRAAPVVRSRSAPVAPGLVSLSRPISCGCSLPNSLPPCTPR